MSNKDIIINMVLMNVGLHSKSCQTYIPGTQLMKTEEINNFNKYFVMYTIMSHALISFKNTYEQ